MASINRANKITIDAFSDPSNEFLGNSGVYSKFTNRLNTPIINAKGIQILNANFVNSALQLNDGYSLMFFYYTNASITAIRTAANLRCIRLLPSSYIPFGGFTAFTRNAYFNTCAELVAALNLAASTGGDNVTYNPRWVAGQVTFSYDAVQRKISVTGNGTNFIAPAAADDPFVSDFLNNTGSFTNQRPVMYGHNATASTYAAATLQPFVVGQSMNARLGFAMGYFTRGLWWGATSQQGCATATGVPHAVNVIEADANPILLGAQNVNVYIDIVSGSGLDSLNRKSLAGSIPIEVMPLNINSYTLSSVEKPLVNVPAEIYEITCELRDELGQPFVQPPNFNTQISFSVYY
jgi:hypothetical protein